MTVRKGKRLMLSGFSSNVISAKAKAMYGKRLVDSDYAEMMRKQTVSEIAGYLKNNTHFSLVLSNINENLIHRGQLENLLRRACFDRYLRLSRYQKSSGRFYYFAVLRAEIEQILLAVMHLSTDAQSDIILSIPAFLMDHASFNLLSLATVHSFSDLLLVLDKTPYKGVLFPFIATIGADQAVDVSACETALFSHYYAEIIARAKKEFSGDVRAKLLRIILMEIDLTNLCVIYRLKKYFGKKSDEIVRYLLPFHYKLTRNILRQMLDSASPDDIVDMSQKKYKCAGTGEKVEYIDEYVRQLRYFLNKRELRFSNSAPLVLYAFMALSEIEVSNITRIIEGVRYKMNPEEIGKLII